MMGDYQNLLTDFICAVGPKDSRGLMGEAERYLSLVNNQITSNEYAPMRVKELSETLKQMDFEIAPLGDVIDSFIEWTKEKVCAEYGGDDNRIGVALILALLVKAFIEIAEATYISYEILFKKCYYEYYVRLGHNPDGYIHEPDPQESVQKFLDLRGELMPSDAQERMKHLTEEAPSLLEQVKQMKILRDDSDPAPSAPVEVATHTEGSLAKYLKENLPPDMAADKKVVETIDKAEESGLLGLISHFSEKIESAYNDTLPSEIKERVCKRIDELVYSVARYNVPVFVKDYLKIVFWLYHVSPEFQDLIGWDDKPDHWDGFLNEMIWYVDIKRESGPLGDGWFREVRDIVVQHHTLEEVLRMSPSSKYFLRLGDSCGTLKHTEVTEDFCLGIVDAYLRNASEYDIESSYAERCVLRSDLKAQVEARGEKFKAKGEYFSPILVYDGKTFTIREDRTYLSSVGVVAVRGIGSVSDYISCLLKYFPFDIIQTGTRFHDIRVDVGAIDEDEYEMPMSPEVFLALERSVCEHCGINPTDDRLVKVRMELARRWIEYKVNLDLCEKVPRRPQDRKPLLQLR